jgi:two-component system, LytTR family, sensor kinase
MLNCISTKLITKYEQTGKGMLTGLLSTHLRRWPAKKAFISSFTGNTAGKNYFCCHKLMTSKKLVNVLLHVLCTMLIIIVPIVFIPLKSDQPDFMNVLMISFTMLQVAAFYFNAYFLYPRLLLRKKITQYILSVVITSILVALLPHVVEILRGNEVPNFFVHLVIKIFIGLFVMAAATAYRFILDVIRQQNILQDNLSMELSFLRSQVSPHFMFNALNSMVSLARKRSDKLEPALLKMSDLMHYMLYDSDEDKVNLQREVEYIRSYIDLQTLRFGNSVKILFMVNVPKDHCIEPMLLVPLIENAFKHGAAIAGEPEISIDLQSNEKEIMLLVSNKTTLMNVVTADRVKGIGLNNLERRLKILYPGNHQLTTAKNGDWFHATLKIAVHDNKVPRRG